MGKIVSKTSSEFRSCRTERKYVMANPWLYFVTITFADQNIRQDYDTVSGILTKYIRFLKDNGIDYLFAFSWDDETGLHIHGVLSDYPDDMMSEITYEEKVTFEISSKTNGKCYWLCDTKRLGFGMSILQEITDTDDCFRISSYIEQNMVSFVRYATTNGIRFKNAFRHSRGLDASSSRRIAIVEKNSGAVYEAVLYFNGCQKSSLLYPACLGNLDHHLHDCFYSRKLHESSIRICGDEYELLFSLLRRTDLEVMIEDGFSLKGSDSIARIMVSLEDYLTKHFPDAVADSRIECFKSIEEDTIFISLLSVPLSRVISSGFPENRAEQSDLWCSRLTVRPP